MSDSLTDLTGVLVVLGNTAPTVSELVPCTQQEAEEAGPLGRKTVVAGQEMYAREVQRPAPGIIESYTSFRYPGHAPAERHPETGDIASGDDYGFSKWLADIKLAFTKQHSLKPPSWVWSNSEAVAQVIALEFGCPVAEAREFGVVYEDSQSNEPASDSAQAE